MRKTKKKKKKKKKKEKKGHKKIKTRKDFHVVCSRGFRVHDKEINRGVGVVGLKIKYLKN
jgi:hypothetical protein